MIDESPEVNPKVGVLRTPLTPLQLELLEIVWWPAGRGLFNEIPPTWPVWDYVARTLQARHPDLDDAVTVLDSLPRLQTAAPFREHPYGLVWRHSHPLARPAPEHKIGLSIAGMAALAATGRLQQTIPDAYAQIIAQLATWESRIEAPPDEVAQQELSLAMFTHALTTATVTKPSAIPDRISAPVLQNEYAPVVTFPVDADDGHQVYLGRVTLRPFRALGTARDYLDAIDQAEASRAAVPRFHSALTLVQTLDYLALVLAADPEWNAGHLTAAPDLQSAAYLVADVHDQHDYQTALSGLCTVIDQLNVPPIPAAELDALPNDHARQDAQGTINRLERWLLDRVANRGDLDRVTSALRVVRDVRQLRVEAQHRSPAKVRVATNSRRRLGLPDTISDYPSAWELIRDVLAGALDVIREEVQAAGRST